MLILIRHQSLWSREVRHMPHTATRTATRSATMCITFRPNKTATRTATQSATMYHV